RGDRNILHGRRHFLGIQPAQARARRLVPGADRHGDVHADDDLETGPRAPERKAQGRRDRPQEFPGSRIRQPAHASRRHGRVPDRGARDRAQCDAAQPQAQQGTAREQPVRHGAKPRGAVDRHQQAGRDRTAGPQLLAGRAALRIQERSRRAARARADSRPRLRDREDEDQLFPLARYRCPDDRPGHGAVARKAVRADAPQRQRGGGLPEPAEQFGGGTGLEDRDLTAGTRQATASALVRYSFFPLAAAIRAAMRSACSSAPVSALPWPTMSNAVPWAGVVNTVSRPAVTVTPWLNPSSLVAIWPWSWYIMTTPS